MRGGQGSGDVSLQRFDEDGEPVGSLVTFEGWLPSVAGLADGGFVVTFSRSGEFGDGSDTGVLARIYNANGTLRVPEFVVNTVTQGHQSFSNVVAIDEDLFLVTRDGSSVAQLFHVGGHRVGSEISIDPMSGIGGSAGATEGWSIDDWGESGFVTGSRSTGDIELTYWDVNRDIIDLGTAAAEAFNGGGATDRIMVGFGGDDDYRIDSAGDELTEIAGEGFDRVRATFSYTLAAGQSIEMLTTTDNLGTGPLNLTGNALSQYIYGNAGANILGGGGGGDVMTGFGGDDRYLVGHAADEVRELAGEGFDRVLASVSWRMAAGQHIEMLTTDDNLGTAPINFFGNEFSQYIYGNEGNNRLWGEGGGDVMYGFGGDDTYYLVHYEDQVREAVGGGIDRIRTTVGVYLTQDQEIEILESYDRNETYPRYLFANLFPNQLLIGNAGDNHLDGGGGGGDVMYALIGDDVYTVRDMTDEVYELAGEGFDRVIATADYKLRDGTEIEILATTDHTGVSRIDLEGNSMAQYVFGHAGVNCLGGGGGGDVLTGYTGDDLYDIVDSRDEIRELAGGGSDRLYATVSYVLNEAAQVEIVSTRDNLAITAINLTGNEFAQYVYGNAGSNTLGGAGGRDVLDGLGGSDLFLFNTALNTGFTASFYTLGESANVDRIDNFGIDDKIVLQGSLFGLTPGALPAGAFNTGTTATQADDRILWDGASGALLFDSDGTGAAAAQLIAFISNPFSLDSTYIAVI